MFSKIYNFKKGFTPTPIYIGAARLKKTHKTALGDFQNIKSRCKLVWGFTLVEILAAVVLLGLAITAIVASNVAYTQATAQAVQFSTAESLIEQIRELTAQLPMRDPNSGTTVFGSEEAGVALYDDVDDFDGASFNPPIDCLRKPLTDFSDYRQAVTVENVSNSNFQQTVADHSSDFVRVTVRILYQNGEITMACWLRSKD